MRENQVGLVEINIGNISETLFFLLSLATERMLYIVNKETKIIELHSEETR